MKEEFEFSKYEFFAGQPLQTFEVVTTDGRKITVSAHEVDLDDRSAALKFVRYELRNVTVTKISGGAKNKQEEEVEMEHPVAYFVAIFHPGKWISFRETETTSEETFELKYSA